MNSESAGLEAIYLRLRKIVVERVTVVKFRVDNRVSDGTGCFRIKVRTDTAELTDLTIAGLRPTQKVMRSDKSWSYLADLESRPPTT